MQKLGQKFVVMLGHTTSPLGGSVIEFQTLRGLSNDQAQALVTAAYYRPWRSFHYDFRSGKAQLTVG